MVGFVDVFECVKRNSNHKFYGIWVRIPRTDTETDERAARMH